MTGISTEFVPVEAGNYEAKFVHFENGISAAGNPKVIMRYEITEEGDAYGRKLSAHRALTKEAMWSLNRDLLALGADPDDISGVFDTDELLPDLLNNDVIISVTLGEPNENGVQFNNIDEVKALY